MGPRHLGKSPGTLRAPGLAERGYGPSERIWAFDREVRDSQKEAGVSEKEEGV